MGGGGFDEWASEVSEELSGIIIGSSTTAIILNNAKQCFIIIIEHNTYPAPLLLLYFV